MRDNASVTILQAVPSENADIPKQKTYKKSSFQNKIPPLVLGELKECSEGLGSQKEFNKIDLGEIKSSHSNISYSEYDCGTVKDSSESSYSMSLSPNFSLDSQIQFDEVQSSFHNNLNSNRMKSTPPNALKTTVLSEPEDGDRNTPPLKPFPRIYSKEALIERFKNGPSQITEEIDLEIDGELDITPNRKRTGIKQDCTSIQNIISEMKGLGKFNFEDTNYQTAEPGITEGPRSQNVRATTRINRPLFSPVRPKQLTFTSCILERKQRNFTIHIEKPNPNAEKRSRSKSRGKKNKSKSKGKRKSRNRSKGKVRKEINEEQDVQKNKDEKKNKNKHIERRKKKGKKRDMWNEIGDESSINKIRGGEVGFRFDDLNKMQVQPDWKRSVLKEIRGERSSRKEKYLVQEDNQNNDPNRQIPARGETSPDKSLFNDSYLFPTVNSERKFGRQNPPHLTKRGIF